MYCIPFRTSRNKEAGTSTCNQLCYYASCAMFRVQRCTTHTHMPQSAEQCPYAHRPCQCLTNAHRPCQCLTNAHRPGQCLTNAHRPCQCLTNAHRPCQCLTNAHRPGQCLTNAHRPCQCLTNAHRPGQCLANPTAWGNVSQMPMTVLLAPPENGVHSQKKRLSGRLVN